MRAWLPLDQTNDALSVCRMEELIPIFLRYVQSRQKPGGYVMFVAHNGKTFDFRFLINEFNRCSYEIPHNWLLLDSLPLARENMKSVGKIPPLLFLVPFLTLQSLGKNCKPVSAC